MQNFDTSFERITHFRPRWVSLSVLRLVALLGFFALSASRVEAACGDYLSHQARFGHQWGGFDQVERPERGEPAESRSRGVPCRGRSCRQGPMQLPLSLPLVTIEPQDRWGWTPSLVIPTSDRVSFLVQPAERVVLPKIAFRLDRPPKA